jgi:3' exoribonuclease, RNase T-like
MPDVMLDIETLGTCPDCVVLTLGAVKFNPHTREDIAGGIYCKPDVDDQIVRGRIVREDTMQWWLDQAEAVREEALGMEDRIPVEQMLRELNRFLVGVKNIWAQGTVFDIGILEHLYKQYNMVPNWEYWQIRDSRTLFGVHGDPRVKGKEGLHNALEDCVSQAEAVQQIFSQIGLSK